MIGVYKIECIPTGKVYIGSSRQVFGRINAHFSKLEKGEGQHNYEFIKDYKTYGIESFTVMVLDICTEEERFNRERYYMAFYDCLNPQKGYNLQKLKKVGVN